MTNNPYSNIYTNTDKSNKLIKYKNLINLLDSLIGDKNKLDFDIKKLKEKIDEYEINNFDLLDEFEKIKNDSNISF